MKMVVNPIFRLLGVPSLLEEYERVEEKCSYRQLDEKEDKMCSILESVLVVVMPGIRERIDTPEVLIANGSNINNPLLHSERAYGKNRNRYGKQKYLLGKIIMNESDFGREKFFETFLQYADICLHIYGADQSKHLNALLTLLAGNIAVESDLMRLAKEKWEVVHDTTESEKD